MDQTTGSYETIELPGWIWDMYSHSLKEECLYVEGGEEVENNHRPDLTDLPF